MVTTQDGEWAAVHEGGIEGCNKFAVRKETPPSTPLPDLGRMSSTLSLIVGLDAAVVVLAATTDLEEDDRADAVGDGFECH
ncbi:hypothetical protein ACLOJK_041131 [Asimina triloba]